MSSPAGIALAIVAALTLATSGCTGATRVDASGRPVGAAASPPPETSEPSGAEAVPAPPAAEIPAPAVPEPTTPVTDPPPITTTTTAPPPPPTTTTAPPIPRRPVQVADTAFATVAGVTLVHPSSVVERVGFHESGHDGARPMDVAPSAAWPTHLPSRGRGTAAATAVDVVIDPGGEVRAPVTGTVKRAGSYVLYCKYTDDYLVIAPDAAPELEVKVLHIQGVQVAEGDHVVAWETVIAPRATPLPFASQVDDFTAKPSWPHVHLEVVDPSVPDRPSPGGGCR